MGNIIYSFLWLIIFFVISFIVAAIGAVFYIVLSPFSVCINPLNSLCDFFMKCIQFPRTCSQNIVDGRGF